MSSPFTHLHLHSQYSLLDGAIRLTDLFPRLHEYGMTSVALTDHGNMFGALDFYKKAIRAEIKPIFGCEVYVAPNMRDRSCRERHHLVLLARNLEGYRNLIYLVSKAHLEGFHYRPRIDRELLARRSTGLFGLSGCLGGEVPQAYLEGGLDRAVAMAREYAGIFEQGRFFLEVQSNGLAEQEEVNQGLIEVSHRTGLGLVATNDCHYLDRADSRAHEILLCIRTGTTMADEGRFRFDTDELFLKSIEEMEQALGHLPEALENAASIADACNVELTLGETYLPLYPVPAGHDRPGYLARLAHDGLEQRFAEQDIPGAEHQAYRERLDRELDVVIDMDFAGYFLIVWDYMKYARDHGVPVGPGRGSGAGSLVAFALCITDLNPIPHGLLFERFINPERVSMPDFDIDFCMNRRDEVIQYITEKYGVVNVGRIATVHSLRTRSVVRDVARAVGLPFSDGDRVARLIPDPIHGRHVGIPAAMHLEPRLQELADADPKVAELLNVAPALEGLNRHVGVHAAGLVIAEEPLWDHCPCFRGKDGELVTQYAKNEVEEVGLVKFDFLGLKTLTVLAAAEELVRRKAPDFEVDQIPLDDRETFEMIQAGQTTGVFQLESSGFKELLKKLQPDSFEDIISAVALYRPGPLEGGMVDDFIDRKHGRVQVEYPHPCLEPILGETYGVIVYQEQVMKMASALAGFSLGQADILRRAMGKRKEGEMARQRVAFLEGAKEKGVELKVAEYIYNLMAKFASYGFNKSHSACYALITLQTAYLKCHYPEEFVAAMLNCDMDCPDNLARYLAEAQAMGIEVLGPDINESDGVFSIVGDGDRQIRMGLQLVRGLGAAEMAEIHRARQERPFSGLYDFGNRTDREAINQELIERLICGGAIDELEAGETRAMLLASLPGVLSRRPRAGRKESECQTAADWDHVQQSVREKDALGFWFSGHPLDAFEELLQRRGVRNIQDMSSLRQDTEVKIAGTVHGFEEYCDRSTRGEVASFWLEDREWSVKVLVFVRELVKYGSRIQAAKLVIVTGRLVLDNDGDCLQPLVTLRSAADLRDVR